jgi:hypothetical protein
MLTPPFGAGDVQDPSSSPVSAEVKLGAALSLGANSWIFNEDFRMGQWAQSSRTDAGQQLQTCCLEVRLAGAPRTARPQVSWVGGLEQCLSLWMGRVGCTFPVIIWSLKQ